MAQLAIRLLGPLEVALDGAPVTRFESEKARALLAFLATEPGRPHRREFLAEMLWPDRPEGAARANLRHTLAGLRRAIGDHSATPPFLLAGRHTLQFNDDAGAWTDVAVLVSWLPAQQRTGPLPDPPPAVLEKAVQLYRGPFLEDLSLGDCAGFEEWRILRREHFNRLVLDALWRLAECCEGCGDLEGALQFARRELELEPWDETAQQQVMRLLACCGRRAEALAHYDAFRRQLAEDLQVEPSPEMDRLYEQIKAGELESSLGQPPLVGERTADQQLPGYLEPEAQAGKPPLFVVRERELAFLDAHLSEALAGHGRVVFVTGGPGRGKTALLDEFGRRAMEAHPDLLVASGNCNAYSGVGDPYLPFREVVGHAHRRRRGPLAGRRHHHGPCPSPVEGAPAGHSRRCCTTVPRSPAPWWPNGRC